ncbi:hypothetical protein C5F63_18820 [Photobacterium damselae subsp. damselae]|uniref:hypothetical protein n=1 Tax=Photobacterium damselae TaxID=38293 RepID=UPI000D0507F0|nr:hypothetical protein [Photobacterium damselae]PSB83446.1 hypothetical protein C5F63_18820 [Photobacterium damselae subsp. damselae]
MANKNSKQERNLNRIQRKTLLRTACNPDNMDALFFPKEPIDGRHPHTQEVILFAEECGWSQEKIAACCGISQPVVSGWKCGDGKATMQQIMPLIQQLSPTGPGQEFYVCQIDDTVSITLPDDWEIKMLAKHSSLSPAFLHKKLWDSIQEQVTEEFKQQEQLLHNELYGLDQYVLQVKKIHPLMVRELDNNDKAKTEYQLALEKLLEENPKYVELDEDSREVLISNKLDKPRLHTIYKDQFNHLKREILASYPALSGENLLVELEQQQNETKKKLSNFRAEREDAVTAALQQKSPLNKFEQSAFPLTIEKPLQYDLKKAKFTEICNDIFKQNKHYKIEIKKQNGYDYLGRALFKNINIDESAQELFEKYVDSLPFDEISTEEVHLCGQYLLSAPTMEDSDESSYSKPAPWFKKYIDNNYDTLDLFRLHSQRLALVHGIYQEKNEKHLFTLKEFSSLDALLDYIKPISTHKTLTKWKLSLMEIGYTTSAARLIY